jgi:predicted dehydrogenase
MTEPPATERPAKLRGAILGYGFIAERGHVPAYNAAAKAFEIVAVADTCPARRARATEALPAARVYEDAASLLAAEAGRLDFVDVATPPSEHAGLARAALERGLHVFCEKPLATTPDDARAMLELAARARRVLYPSHTYKHAPIVARVNAVLAAGTIGRPRLLTLQTFRTTHARGVAEWRPDWRRERRWSGGGIAMDHGPHTFYLAFEWLGAYPTAITAKTATLGAFDTEDNVSCALTFPDGMATAELSWTAGVRKVLYTIHGDRGAIRVEDDDLEVTRLRTSDAGHVRVSETSRQRATSAWHDAGHGAWFEALFAKFHAAVRARGSMTRERETDDALRCVELTAAVYASAADGNRAQPLEGRRVRASQPSEHGVPAPVALEDPRGSRWT